MSTTTERPITAQLNSVLDMVTRKRERLMTEHPSAGRAENLAGLYELEARVWATLFEHSRTRVQWRAALAAEAYARQLARLWRDRAAEARRASVAADQRQGAVFGMSRRQQARTPSVESMFGAGGPDGEWLS